MKIYFASQSFFPNIGGVSTHIFNLLGRLNNMGHDVREIHLRSPKEETEDNIRNIQVTRVPKEPITKESMKGFGKFKETFGKALFNKSENFEGNVFDIEGYKQFSEINKVFGEAFDEVLKNHPAEIVHVHDFQFQLMMVYKYITRGIPLIMTWHGPFLESMNEDVKKFIVEHMSAFDKVIFLTQEYLDEAVKVGFPREKGAVIPPIANQRFKKMDIDKNKVKEKYSIPKDSKVILCVQRMDWRSSHKQLIKSMPKILEENPDAVLVFVGDNSEGSETLKKEDMWDTPKSEVSKLVEELGLSENVIFTGNIENPKLPEVYNMADVVASVPKLEAFGLSITEGMMCGKPVVGSNVGGIVKQVKDGENGYLVEIDDIEATAKKISKILSDKTLRKEMGEQSLKIVKRFSPEKIVGQHVKLYQDLLKEKSDLWRLKMKNLDSVDGLILDFDRTLTGRPGIIEDNIFEKLKTLKDLDKSLVLETSKSFRHAKKLYEKYPIWSSIVAENGSIVYFPDTKKSIVTDSKYMKKARELVRKSSIQATVQKVIIRTKLENKKKLKEILKPVEDRISFEKNVDEFLAMPLYVNKSKGTLIALDHVNCDPEKTIIFGDGENDVSLFNVPGYKVAVSNARKKLKDIADEVTNNPKGKGVLEAIKKLEK